MTSKLKLLVASSSVSLAVLCSAPAFAGGTLQGTDIQNVVTVNFQVGGVNQQQQNATNSFKVDRKVLFSIIERTPAGTTTVNPGQTLQKTAFTLTNNSNDILDFALTPSNLTAGAATPRGTDAFDVSNFLLCFDNNGDNNCDATATASLTVDDLGIDASTNILVLADIPVATSNGQIAGVSLSAAARNSTGTLFTAATDSTVNDPNNVETIFADTARDGIETATDDYTVSAAILSVFKSSQVVSDGVSGSNFKSVPGAVVEYCISVANAAGGALATNVSISDVVPSNMTFVTGSIRINAAVTNIATAAQTCGAGTAGGSESGGTVTGTLSDIAAGQSQGLAFQAVIN